LSEIGYNHPEVTIMGTKQGSKPEPRTLPRKFFTVPEVARYLRKSPRTVIYWLREGKLRGKRIGGRDWLIAEEDLARFLEECPPRPGEAEEWPPSLE
jgi:excisionase family DNA binding protein